MSLNKTKFAMAKDINGVNGFGLPFSIDNVSTVLTTGVEQTYTIPDKFGKNECLAIFAPTAGANVWVSKNVSATTPGAAFAPTNSCSSPISRVVSGGDEIHFITADTAPAELGISLYEI